ncbi:MAG: ABC transporter permease [Thermomicrobiales bacterium]
MLAPGEQGYLLGTDHLGRDMLAQIAYGARVSLTIGLLAASISLIVGVIVGSIAGYYGGWVDILLSRLIDMFLIIPAFFLIIVVVATLGSGIIYVMIIIGLTAWPTSTPDARANARPARTLRPGAARPRRIKSPHPRPPHRAKRDSAATRQRLPRYRRRHLIEAGLSFIGLGDPNRATWGRMIFDGRTTVITTAWWVSVIPVWPS